MIVTARCIAHAFNSREAIQYFPGLDYKIDFTHKEQRKLLWLKTPRGKWIFVFDRANSSSLQDRMWFCKECGEPFDRFTEFGNHCKTVKHRKDDSAVRTAEQIEADIAEEKAIAELEAAESKDDNEQNVMLKNAIAAQKGDRELEA